MSSMGRRVRVSARRPQAAAVCDRCGLWRNRVDLVWQMKFAGASVVSTGLLVCPTTCLDRLNPLDRPRILRPDGLPIRDPRPEPYSADSTNYLLTEGRIVITDESLVPLIVDDVVGLDDILVCDDGAILVCDDGSTLGVSIFS